MEFKNPNGQTAKTTALMVAGLVVGAMASRGVYGLFEKGTTSTVAADIKKEKLIALGKRGAIVAAGGFAAAGLQGKDDMSIVLKNAALGAAVMQAIDGIKDAAADHAPTAALKNGTSTQKVIAKSLGLACPCDSQPLMALPLHGHRTHKRLRNPALVHSGYDHGTPIIHLPNYGTEMNSLQQAMNSGAMAV